jgi:hypothetical protein
VNRAPLKIHRFTASRFGTSLALHCRSKEMIAQMSTRRNVPAEIREEGEGSLLADDDLL